MPEKNPENILERLRAGDKSALHQLFLQYYELICKSIFRLIKDKGTVEDLAQEVFIKIWQKRHQLHITTSMDGYIRRMAVNEAISYLRKTKMVNPLNESDIRITAVSTEQQYLQEELRNKVAKAIAKLPPKCRLVFQLSRYEGLSYREIAKQLDLSIKTVENQMGKALKTLREELKEYLSK